MKGNEEIPWKRISIEAAAIVGSILLAFAIDAWWEERHERIDETEQLARLHVEFLKNIERIDERVWESEILDACIEVFDLIEAAQRREVAEIEVLESTMRRVLTAPTFDADTPILNGLIRSGRLEIVEDERILAPLATWERLLRDYTSFAERARRSLDLHLLPAISLRGDVGSLLMRRSNFIYGRGVANTTDYVTIRIDQELKVLVAERYRNGRIAVDMLGRARKAADDVIGAIEATQSN